MTPCILPWINFGTSVFGRSRVCGYSKIKSENKLENSSILQEWNNKNFREIRRDFLADKWPKNCSHCQYVEERGGVSKRLEENERNYDQYRHLIAATSSDGTCNYSPPHIDVRTGNICNLKCIHCSTGTSSKWKEDKQLIGKYPNTEDFVISNKWIEQDSEFWDHLRSLMGQTQKYNFLGGESFANKQHNKFLKDLSQSEYAKSVFVSYTTNAVLLNLGKLEQLNKFGKVQIRISIDAISDPLEYFRFPIKWQEFLKQLRFINDYVDGKGNFEVLAQWTCSNISIFYLVETYDFIRNNFPNIKFVFCDYVSWPLHMSAQVLPTDLKLKIQEKINSYAFKQEDSIKYPFYINHMLEKDLWIEQGNILLQYLDDLDNVRNISWKNSFKEMHLGKYKTPKDNNR
jgi:MoaA/NifB/PqqE/SkfB family radical SAM enzyme